MQVRKKTSSTHPGERTDLGQQAGVRRNLQQSHRSFGYAVAQSLRQDLMDSYSAGVRPVGLSYQG